MPDISHLLKQPAGRAEPPKPLEIGDYPGLVKSYEPSPENRNKTPGLRFQLVLTGWPDGVFPGPDSPDITKRTMRKDFYLTEDALYRLDKFIRSCGIEPNDRPYDEILPQLVGKPVLIQVQHYLNQQTNQVGNSVGELVGMA